MSGQAVPMGSHAGYTLLELLVVVAVIALATGLVAPAGFRMLGSWERAAAVDDLLEAMARLPESTRAAGAGLHVAAGTHGSPFAGQTLPEGWRVELEGELRILANGVCLGTRGAVLTDGPRQPFVLEAPDCRARRLEAVP